jgi:hypothetical protein
MGAAFPGWGYLIDGFVEAALWPIASALLLMPQRRPPIRTTPVPFSALARIEPLLEHAKDVEDVEDANQWFAGLARPARLFPAGHDRRLDTLT